MKARRHVQSGLQLMLTPEALVPFLVGAIALAILGDAAYDWLLSMLGTKGTHSGAIAVVTGFVLLGSAGVCSRVVNRDRPAPPLPGKRPPKPRKGLIVLVSNSTSLAKAIEYHSSALEHCWMVISGRSAQVAEAATEGLRQNGKQAYMVAIDDVYDPVEMRNKIAAVYAALPDGLAESDVILDFTGMTAVASVGSVLACLNADRPIQYTPPEFDKDMKPVAAKDPIEIALDYGMLGVVEPGK